MMISQVELSKGCLFPCPIYTQVRLSVLLIRTASAFPTGPSYPSPLKCKCPRIQGKLALSPNWVFFRTGLWSVWGFLNPLSLEFWLLRKLRT